MDCVVHGVTKSWTCLSDFHFQMKMGFSGGPSGKEPIFQCRRHKRHGFDMTCIQIAQEAGQVVWYSHLFKNFPQFVEGGGYDYLQSVAEEIEAPTAL